ncbi:MAG: phytanoyl-CoA dioxygenase family protein [Ilumatobacteraceae bacterium]
MSIEPRTAMNELAERYRRDGVISVRIINADEAAHHRSELERGEAELGPLHYLDKVHTVMTSPYRLATLPAVLDLVESLIGPDVLLYNCTYIIKEPGSEAFVAWHQDLTYWGLDDPQAQVSMWLALAPATVESGCMSMIPGSHISGPMDHVQDATDANLLLMGQRVSAVDTSAATAYPLAPGEASFHHGWTVHASGPNTTSERRIGLNVQYLAAHNRHVSGDAMSAMLVRGDDAFGHFGVDVAPESDFEPPAVSNWRGLDSAMKAGFKGGPDADSSA